MKIGDKVKSIKGKHIGKVSVVKRVIHMAKSITNTDNGEEKAEYEDYCVCEAEDGTTFFTWEDVLEQIE